MEIANLNKLELICKCKELGIKKYSSKNKLQLIELIQNRTLIATTTAQESASIVQIHKTNCSPLRYPGGKTRACKILDSVICKHFNLQLFDTFVSPFFGGGSFEFYVQNKYNFRLCVNDKFIPLYNFWKQIKADKQQLSSELRKITTITKEDFTNYRKSIVELNDNTLQQAIQYFIINRCSFSGSTLSGGFSEEASKKRYTPSSIDKIEALDFSSIDIHNFDFEYFIKTFTTDKSIIFLDPPYYLNKKSKLYGNNGDMHEHFNHQELFDVIKTKRNWIITYNNCEYIKNLYKDYIILEVNWSYGMNKSKTSSEIIIVSN
jgi:DNA adenine methylase